MNIESAKLDPSAPAEVGFVSWNCGDIIDMGPGDTAVRPGRPQSANFYDLQRAQMKKLRERYE